MANRKLILSKMFLRDSKKININIKKDITLKADKLIIDPFHPELNIKKLSGHKDKYRVVIINNFRLVYSFNKTYITLVSVKHRKDIYNTKF